MCVFRGGCADFALGRIRSPASKTYCSRGDRIPGAKNALVLSPDRTPMRLMRKVLLVAKTQIAIAIAIAIATAILLERPQPRGEHSRQRGNEATLQLANLQPNNLWLGMHVNKIF